MSAPSGNDEPRRGRQGTRRRARAGEPRRRAAPTASDLALLRELLLGPERERIAELERKPGLRELQPEDVQRVLARAVELGARESDELPRALRPSVEGAIERSAERDPEVLARAIAPVVGRALRKSAAAALGRLSAVPLRVWPVVVIVVLGLAVLGVRSALSRAEEAGRWRDAERRLAAEPGFVLVGVSRDGGEHVFRGLRDPLAREAAEVVAEAGVDLERARFEWQPYHSLEEAFALRRARLVLAPPETVSLSLDGGVLVAEGQAASDWIRRARDLSGSLLGVSRFDAGTLEDVDLEECRRLANHLDGRKVQFPSGSADLDPELTGMSGIETAVARLDAAARRAGLRVVIEVRPEILPPEVDAGLGVARNRCVKERIDAVPRAVTLTRTDDDEKIVGYLNGGPEGKLPRVILKVSLVGEDGR